jgi:hypothetical protein
MREHEISPTCDEAGTAQRVGPRSIYKLAPDKLWVHPQRGRVASRSESVAGLRKMGLKVAPLSGDTQGVTSAVGRALGVDQAMGEYLSDLGSTARRCFLL